MLAPTLFACRLQAFRRFLTPAYYASPHKRLMVNVYFKDFLILSNRQKSYQCLQTRCLKSLMHTGANYRKRETDA